MACCEHLEKVVLVEISQAIFVVFLVRLQLRYLSWSCVVVFPVSISAHFMVASLALPTLCYGVYLSLFGACFMLLWFQPHCKTCFPFYWSFVIFVYNIQILPCINKQRKGRNFSFFTETNSNKGPSPRLTTWVNHKTYPNPTIYEHVTFKYSTGHKIFLLIKKLAIWSNNGTLLSKERRFPNLDWTLKIWS